MKNYPNIKPESSKDVFTLLRYITRERRNDVNDFNNLRNIFVSGRKVDKIPTGAADISSPDRVGDFNFDADYIYICVDNSGAAWRRVALSSW